MWQPYCVAEPEWTWSRLTRAQVRDHGRAIVAAAFEREGFKTQPSDAVVHASRGGVALEAHVRTLRKPVYAFWEKRRFELAPTRFAALVLLIDERAPAAFLVPSLAWRSPNRLVVSRDYEGLASEPEWGLNLSGRSMPLLEEYAIARVLRSLARAA
jgi:hypothetical protein